MSAKVQRCIGANSAKRYTLHKIIQDILVEVLKESGIEAKKVGG